MLICSSMVQIALIICRTCSWGNLSIVCSHRRTRAAFSQSMAVPMSVSALIILRESILWSALIPNQHSWLAITLPLRLLPVHACAVHKYRHRGHPDHRALGHIQGTISNSFKFHPITSPKTKKKHSP